MNQDIKEKFKLKFNEVLHRIYNLEIIPEIQSRINERIPERGGFMVFESKELEDFLEQALIEAKEDTIEEPKYKCFHCGGNMEVKECLHSR